MTSGPGPGVDGPRTVARHPLDAHDADVHILGPTLMPGSTMPRFYQRLADRLTDGQADARVAFHPMPAGGVGRTDEIVHWFRPLVHLVAATGRRVTAAGHSLGGIVLWALAHDHPTAFARIELWAAPVRGTALATVDAPVAEARFLARESRFLKRLDRPLDGVPVRAIYSVLDRLATPALEVCTVHGDLAENHVVAPVPLSADRHRSGLHVHRGLVGHTLLPRKSWLQRALAVHDAATPTPAGSASR